MSKPSQLDRAIQSLDDQIAVLEKAKAALVAQKAEQQAKKAPPVTS